MFEPQVKKLETRTPMDMSWKGAELKLSQADWSTSFVYFN